MDRISGGRRRVWCMASLSSDGVCAGLLRRPQILPRFALLQRRGARGEQRRRPAHYKLGMCVSSHSLRAATSGSMRKSAHQRCSLVD